MPVESQARSTITFQDMAGDSQAQHAFNGTQRRNPVNVTVSFDGEAQPTLLKNQKVSYDGKGDILLAPLLETLVGQGFDFDGQFVSYYSDKDLSYVHLGRCPVDSSQAITTEDLNQASQPLQIKLRVSAGAAAAANR